MATRILVLTVGGACGVNARYWLGLFLGRWLGTRFPWATVLINVSGSFAIGCGAMILAERWPHPLVRIFALTGFLGGYTTFSAYMLESYTLWEKGDRALATANVVGSLVAGLVAVTLGVMLGQWLTRPHLPTPRHEVQVEQRFEEISAELAGHAVDVDPPA